MLGNLHARMQILCLPAARLARTALLVYNDAQTFEIAPDSAAASEAGILPIESYNPAPDMPAKSSTFAEDRTMTVAPSPKCEPTRRSYASLLRCPRKKVLQLIACQDLCSAQHVICAQYVICAQHSL